MSGGPIAEGNEDGDDGESFAMTPEELEARMLSLLDTCTYTVFNYTRRGLFDRDKLIVLTLLTFNIGACWMPPGCGCALAYAHALL